MYLYRHGLQMIGQAMIQLKKGILFGGATRNAVEPIIQLVNVFLCRLSAQIYLVSEKR